MFGYVRPYKAELLVREYEQYKAIYCELCRELGKSFGIGARFILSYDCTFYAMLALSLTDSIVKGEKKRCTVNPMKQCSYLSSEGEEYKKAAGLSVLMTYHKLKDNVADETFFKSMAARIGKLLISKKYTKAKRLYPEMEEIISNAMQGQLEAEKNNSKSIDRCCEPTAKMLSQLFQQLACEKNTVQTTVLREFGYYLGRWIYTMDAADDLADDISSKSFNPFIHMLGLERFAGIKQGEKGAFDGKEKEHAQTVCNEVLNRNIARMIPAFNLLDLCRFGTIIENIIKKGLPEIQRELLFLHVKEKRNDRSV